ncbi:hypothetical protein AWB78_05319 [Caballeronia calidae]|uniref:Lipoprotein n=1 Tax=Caballeronia calidae TaxID=1777139 RepID=A0A158DKY1_9BURK|nr:hypothetical protein [Caballeronia calidae]SAK95244.1 hypothetical protein AWB78_05319 [Caballeronia calidae]
MKRQTIIAAALLAFSTLASAQTAEDAAWASRIHIPKTTTTCSTNAECAWLRQPGQPADSHDVPVSACAADRYALLDNSPAAVASRNKCAAESAALVAEEARVSSTVFSAVMKIKLKPVTYIDHYVYRTVCNTNGWQTFCESGNAPVYRTRTVDVPTYFGQFAVNNGHDSAQNVYYHFDRYGYQKTVVLPLWMALALDYDKTARAAAMKKLGVYNAPKQPPLPEDAAHGRIEPWEMW